MKRTARWFWAIVGAQAIFLLAWAGYHEGIRHSAPVILLKVRPVDPQDLLRGDYMTLNYDISDVPLATSEISVGREVWVLLEPKGRYCVVIRAAGEPLAAGPGQFVARGTTRYSGRSAPANAHVDYGIEQYYVPEGKGAPRFKLAEVEASVSPAHRLYIRRVLLDGKAYP